MSRFVDLLILMCFFSFVEFSQGEPPEIEWNRTFGGSLNDYAHFVQQTRDGGYIVAGETGSYGSGREDVWLIKTDSDGKELWNKTFGGAVDDKASSVQQTGDGGYIIAGGTRSNSSGGEDVWLIKTDSDGNEQWNKTFGGSLNDYAYSAQQTSDGGYIVAGMTCSSYSAGERNAWLIKTDSDGNEKWDKTFEKHLLGSVYSVQQTSDGGYIAAGEAIFSSGNDVWLIKTDSAGNEQWDKTFGGAFDDYAWSVQQTSDDGYIIAGETRSYGTSGNDVWLIKTDSAGNEQWNKTFGGAFDDKASSVQQTSDGGYIVAGETDSSGFVDIWLIKTGPDGSGTETGSSVMGTISGKVLNALTNDPVVGAKIDIAIGGESLSSVSTDSNGMYSTAGTRPSDFIISCTAQGYQSYSGTGRTNESGYSLHEILLEPAKEIERENLILDKYPIGSHINVSKAYCDNNIIYSIVVERDPNQGGNFNPNDVSLTYSVKDITYICYDSIKIEYKLGTSCNVLQTENCPSPEYQAYMPEENALCKQDVLNTILNEAIGFLPLVGYTKSMTETMSNCATQYPWWCNFQVNYGDSDLISEYNHQFVSLSQIIKNIRGASEEEMNARRSDVIIFSSRAIVTNQSTPNSDKRPLHSP